MVYINIRRTFNYAEYREPEPIIKAIFPGSFGLQMLSWGSIR